MSREKINYQKIVPSTPHNSVLKTKTAVVSVLRDFLSLKLTNTQILN